MEELSAFPWGFWVLAAGIFGLLSGSFLNVVIYRLPKMMERDFRREAREILAEELPETQTPEERFNLLVPASACPHCHAPVRAWQNIPVISYLFLRGRCASCQGKISICYPLIELLCAVAFAVTAAVYYPQPIAVISGLILTAALICLAMIDADTQLLPDSITLPLMWLGLIVNMDNVFVPFQVAFWGAIVGYMSLWTLFWIFKLLTGKDGMGYGDFKLLAALGAWMGLYALPIIIFGAAILGIVAFIIMRRFGRAMPFGPSLAISGWLCFIFLPQAYNLVFWWLHASGFR